MLIFAMIINAVKRGFLKMIDWLNGMKIKERIIGKK